MKRRLFIFYSAIIFSIITAYGQSLSPGVVLPDNIINADCYVNPPKQNWSMGYSKSSAMNLSPYQNAVVGDIDGDGIVEILVSADPNEDNPISIATRNSNKIAVYKGNNLSAPPKIITTTQPYSWDAYTKYAIVRTKIAGKDITLIVVAERDLYLRAYDSNGTRIWTSDNKYHSTSYNCVTITFADLNKDGTPEVMIGNKVFNSTNGKLLCQTATELSGDISVISIPIIEDIFRDGNVRFIQGNKIYKPNAALTSLPLERTISASVHASDPDKPTSAPAIPNGGRAAVVDMDLDGKPDLVVSVRAGNYAFIYIADPTTGAIKASKLIPGASMSSYPFVGDIDGDGYPEIVFITAPTLKIYAYKYEPGEALLKKFWELPHTDGSGVTTMTLFDFNQDGISEIVYRDETHLRIINGSLIHHTTGASVAAPYNLASFKCSSGTSTEYPVVADVDNDNQAEIVIVGGNDKDVDPHYLGHL